jgi:gas vesicle protein
MVLLVRASPAQAAPSPSGSGGQKMQKALNFVLGFVLGGLVGGSITLLITPLSGNELRTEVKDYSRHVRDEMEQAYNSKRIELERDLAQRRGEIITD